jgi:hypothetical protein
VTGWTCYFATYADTWWLWPALSVDFKNGKLNAVEIVWLFLSWNVERVNDG